MSGEVRRLHRQKIEAVGELAGGIAHDFNNLLTAINGHAEHLLTRADLAADVRQSVEAIARAGHLAAVLTARLLAFSRQQHLQPVRIDVRTVVDELVPILRRLIGEHIDLRIRQSPDPATVEIDRGQFEQILVNLVANARDVMASGGDLVIETGVREVPPDDLPDGELGPGRYVCLAVTDTGHGVKPEHLERLWEPFFTTKPPGRGTGLGLAAVHGIVMQSGGGVRVDTQVGIGSTFSVFLPFREMTDVAAPAPPVEPDLGGSERVLIVEDSDEVRLIAKQTLVARGYDVTACARPMDALRIIDGGARFDLLITDIVMPEIDGRTLAGEILARQPSIRLLFVSGYTEYTVMHHGVVDPDVNFLAKPFTPNELSRRVRAALG